MEKPSYHSKLLKLQFLIYFLVAVCIYQQFLILRQPKHNEDSLKSRGKLLNHASIRVFDDAPSVLLHQQSFVEKHPIRSYPSTWDSIHKKNIRVACLIPFIGNSLPSWFDAFVSSAYTTTPLFDYFIFVTKAVPREVPPNVKIIRISERELFKRLIMLDVHDHSKRHIEFLTISLAALIKSKPYLLVEFKPALGVIFNDYIETYSHWAIADLDILIGRLQNVITPKMLMTYDIYSSSFGDSWRLYMRGQLTIHRNIPFINNIWKHCTHLSQIGERIEKYIKSPKPKWKWESSEGCYSKVIFQYGKNLSILIATTQLSAFGGTLQEKETFMLGNAMLRCHEKPVDSNLITDFVNM